MVSEVVMPKAGLTMVEGTIMEWLVEEGTQVKKGDAIMEYENEKSTIKCEALADGILHITAQVGDTVPIGVGIGYLADSQAEYQALLNAAPAAPGTPVGQECAKSEAVPAAAAPAGAAFVPSAVVAEGGHVRASGLARKMAAEAGIDLALVPASSGRVQAKDVEAYLAASKPAPALAAAADEDEITEIPWIGVKKTIAGNMLRSMQSTAQSTCMLEVDVTEFLALRKKLAAQQEMLGFKVSVNDLLCKMLGKVMAEHPLANTTFDGKTLYSHKHVHLSVAVSTDGGLMVPVVRNIDTLSLAQIHGQIKTLAQQAKDRCLPVDAQSGGTCMITNFGVFPMDFATPILNAPQTCIVGFGRPVRKAVVLPDDTICARHMMYVTVTLDHQVIDGNEVGRIFADIQSYLEHPETILA